MGVGLSKIILRDKIKSIPSQNLKLFPILVLLNNFLFIDNLRYFFLTEAIDL